MKKITLFISVLCLIGSGIFAQNGKSGVIFNPKQLGQDNTPTATIRTCGTMDMVSQEELNAFQEWLAPKVATYLNQQAMGGSPESVYNIPTIVHVIHNSNEGVGTGRNIPNARVMEQIQILNDDFGRTNLDAGNTPAAFLPVAANTEISFCLIEKYPSGHPQAGQALSEVGINRVSTASIAGISNTTSGYSQNTINNSIKPATIWNVNEVMNIWVCQLQGNLLGYAQFPNSGSANTDGTVMGYQYFGNTSSAPFHLGRTTTHEVGHWLGLVHINGDSNCGNDNVADTPTQASLTNGCPSHPRPSCGSDDMFQNYMDYSNDNCMNIFTNGQKVVMQNIMATANRRSTLPGFSATLCSAPALTANFSANTTVISAGQTVTFTDASVGPNPITSWTWDFDVASVGGVAPGTASTQGPHVVTYNNAGTFSVSLLVGDGSSTDTETKTAYIVVNPVGTVVCDSTDANWDWNTESYGGGYWGPDCNGPTLNSGYIMGNNCYDDNGWASKVSFSAVGKELTDVLYVFIQSSGTGAGALKVWNADGAGGAPNTVLHQTSINTGDYSANLNQLIGVPVSPAVALSGDFFIGNDHAVIPLNGDSLVMGVANGTTGNQVWANETAGWNNLSVWGVDYKGTVISVICDIATGEKEILGEINEVSVFPNPSLGTINIALTVKEASTIEIYNVLGKLIYNNALNTQYVSVDVSDEPNGVYLVNIKTGNSIVTKKVILAK